MADHLFLKACRGEPVERTPVWMMRQAGRYMPEYRAIREKVSFLELCKTPEIACEVTLQPIDAFGFDAAILFADILLPLEPMGLPVVFGDGGPKLKVTVTDRASVDKLVVADPEEALPYVMESVRTIRRALNDCVPLIGFAGAPFTMATYAVEGGGSKSYAKTKGMMFSDPSAFHSLMDKLSENCAAYLAGQIAAGAQAIQIFDSWAGILSPSDFREFALRHSKSVIERVRASKAFADAPERVPIIYFVNGCAPYLADYATAGADVLGVDWRVDLRTVRETIGDDVALQGNLDPTALFASKERLADLVKGVLDSHGRRTGHIFNLGHGVLPPTNPEHVREMIRLVREYSPSLPL